MFNNQFNHQNYDEIHTFKMKNKKTSVLAIVFFFIGVTRGTAQQKKLSAFLTTTPTEALYEFMASEIDTLVINKLSKPWVFQEMTFKNVKNKVLMFEYGVVIQAKKDAFPKKNDSFFKFIDCENISIIGNHSIIRMNKEKYVDGEWRHVIRLRGCKNFDISDLTLRDSGGDGIAIGRSKKVWFSKNIRLDNLQCINNKRQGISITSAEDVWVSNSCFADTIGTAPGAGVDIEPNVPEERIVNVNFNNCIFKNNYNVGINIGLPKLLSSSKKVSIRFENCTLENNFSEENTKIPSEIRIQSHKTDPVKGTVVFKGCTIKNSKWRMLYARKNAEGFKVSFEDFRAEAVCSSPYSGAVIYLEVPHYSKDSNLGGYHFSNVTIDYTADKPIFMVRGSKRNPLNRLENLSGEIVVTNPNLTVKPEIQYIGYMPLMDENISLKIKKKN
ncbi:MAG: hypothetical protein Mars2KO_10020 [Maribacter sp.]